MTEIFRAGSHLTKVRAFIAVALLNVDGQGTFANPGLAARWWKAD